MPPWITPKRSALAIVWLAFFTDALVYAMLPPLLPGYARTHGLSQTELGFLYGCYAAALLISTLPFGALVDRQGRRGTLLAGLVGFAAATILFTFAATYPQLLLARVFQGIAASATWVAGLALLADHFPQDQRGKAMSTAFAASNLGLFLGPGFAGWMEARGTPRLAFLAVAGLTALDALARLMLLPEETRERAPALGYLRFLKNPDVCILAGAMGMGAALGAALEAVLPVPLSQDLGMGPGALGVAFTFTALASVVTSPLAGAWTDRKGARGPLGLGLALGAVLLLLVPRLCGKASVYALLFLVGSACSLLQSPTGPALAEVAERNGRAPYGTAFSILNIAFALGILVGPLAGSALADALGLKATLVLFALGFVLYQIPLSRLGRKHALPWRRQV